VALIGIVLGVPLGIAAERLVWNDFQFGCRKRAGCAGLGVVLLVVPSPVGDNFLAIGPALLAARPKAASPLSAA
jgi:hypothetical protein